MSDERRTKPKRIQVSGIGDNSLATLKSSLETWD